MKTLLFTLLTLVISQVSAIRPAPADPQEAPQTYINATQKKERTLSAITTHTKSHLTHTKIKCKFLKEC